MNSKYKQLYDESQLRDAVTKGDFNRVKDLVENQKINVNVPLIFSGVLDKMRLIRHDPLYCAIKYCHPEIEQYLLQKGSSNFTREQIMSV
jgi:hypothetical protein